MSEGGEMEMEYFRDKEDFEIYLGVGEFLCICGCQAQVSHS